MVALPFRPPRQARSRQTLDRLLAAAEGLLEEKGFEQATVAEIARRARSSVGSFYTRFPDKEALLQCFDERFFARGRESWDAFLADPRWRRASVADLVRELVRILVRKNRANRALLRALALYARGRPDPRFRERSHRLNAYVLDRVRTLLLARRSDIRHANPALAIDLGLTMVASAVREIVLFQEGYGLAPRTDDGLAAELARAWLAYLGVRERAPAPRNAKRSSR